MEKQIALLPGDGIGEEVCREAVKVLEAVASKAGHKFEFTKGLIGGAAWDDYQSHFPEETREICACLLYTSDAADE